MIQDFLNNSYDNSYNPSAKATDGSLVLYFNNKELLCHAKGNVESLEQAIPGKAGSEEVLWSIPTLKELNKYKDISSDILTYLFKMELDGKKHDFYLLNDDNIFNGTALEYGPRGSENGSKNSIESGRDESGDGFDYYYIPALKFRSLKPLSVSFAVITGWQLYCWYMDNSFCGRCGHKTILDSKERMVRCPECNNLIYPKICPGVIVGIVSKGRLLLTKYARKGYNRYALVAGFTEIGETLEESAAREAFEEVGLRLKNITFYKSQPWSASSSLLAGFFAEANGSDEVTLETDELKEGTWFYPEDIVKMNEGVSLTEEMINYFADGKMDARWYERS